ncbi:hypothetical protein J1N35_023692 [Gossypium stocksii]|uniref:Uncharacterized protein n=1 Tax=Gossypium stocksii TaxID=47602 RepID=A0A9D4A2B8_9ROSI|nr:hypothetical protein J1N35_023692 [Gossypium stocksii]
MSGRGLDLDNYVGLAWSLRMQFPWKRARIQMEEDDYDNGDGSYGEEEDDEKAGFLSLLNKGILLKWVLIESVTCQKKFFAISFPSYQQNLHDEEYADYWAGNGNAFTDYEIIVDAPKLEVLRYKSYVANGCSFKNCLSVVRAVIDISDNGKRGDVSTIGLKPLTGTYNAKFLSIIWSFYEGKDNAKLNTRDLVKIHMGATAVHS